jgi:hypothetical protein
MKVIAIACMAANRMNDIALTEILLPYLPEADIPTGEAIRTILESTEDQTAKAVVMLPLDLLHQLGWKTGDRLSISKDSPGGLTVRRAEVQKVRSAHASKSP